MARAIGDSPLAIEQKKIYYWFVMPSFLLYTLFYVVPALFTVYISFFKWAGAGEMKYVGWRNYEYLYWDDAFLISFLNTMKILFLVGGLTFLISFCLTMALREMAGRKFARSVVFFPNIVSGVAVALLWGIIFRQEGLLNQVLIYVGISEADNPIPWWSEDNIFNIIIVIMTWGSIGFYTTVLMAAVDRIPKYLYEDCLLSGASTLETFRYVTLPLLWEVFTLCALLWTIGSIKTFEIILTFAGTGKSLPPYEVWTTAIYTYMEGFPHDGVASYGTASSSALVMFIFTLMMVTLLRRIMNRTKIQY